MINNKEQQQVTLFDWIGAISGVCGASIIALNLGIIWYGYLLFMISSLCYSYIGWKINKSGLMIMSLLYIVINIIGLIQWK